MALLEISDLAPFLPNMDEAKAQAMIEDALALAVIVAPCIDSPEFANTAAAKAVLRSAVLRWYETGVGATTTQTAGPFAQTIETKDRRGMFWPSEIELLQSLCRKTEAVSDAFTVTPYGAPDATAGDPYAYGRRYDAPPYPWERLTW